MGELSISWNHKKNIKLREKRGIGFEDVVAAINDNRLIATISNPSSNFSNQKAMIVEIGKYAIVVPYVADDASMFLKTLYPGRKATKQFLKG